MSAMTQLRDINDVRRRSESNDACFAELRAVLEKHGCLDRFGVLLLHGHFPVNENEILVEECDQATRTLTIRPMSVDEVKARPVVQTQWRLDTDDSVQGCIQVCTEENDPPHRHTGSSYHN
jgi:hypothetical protein